MQASYWSSFAGKRLSRRRALAATGATAIGGTFLAACGGGEKTTSEGKSDLITKTEDTTKQAVRGGTYKTFINTDAGSWDAHVRGAWFGTLGGFTFSRLTVVKPGFGEESTGEVVGDLAEGWEISPDGLTATFKVRTNGHFAPVAPVNGRQVDSQDVIATWNRWRKISSTRATIDNEVNPDAPVISMAAPDAKTVTMKLAFPAVTLPSLLSASVGQSFHILPREADTGYDPRRIAIGSGAYYVTDHSPSAYIHFRRNPNFHFPDLAFMEGLEYPIVSQYATALAAFRAGQLYFYPVRAEEILTVKREVPDLNMYQSSLDLPISAATMFFGYKATDKGMFRDKRLRQAYSMAIDRDLFSEVWYNVSKFTSQGLPVEAAWSSVVPANEFAGWWLDPQGKDFGPNAKYYKLNLPEAKKLIAAAGFSNGVEYKSTRAGDNYGPEYDHQIEVLESMVAEAGFKPQTNVVNYQNDLIPNYQSVQGEFEGGGWMLRPQSSSDPIDKLAEFVFSKSGPNFIGFDVNGKGDHSGDPTVDEAIRKSKVERDTAKRRQILHDLQRYMAEQMYMVRPVSGATGFDLAWPVIKNFDYVRGPGARRSQEIMYFWLDQTKKPISRA